ncbi:sensor histidine kinase [Streptomyces sp. HSG2]|uniref:sensor histidine kinase n=1 Tax=Streptomyces sp. HSG2 TaxID=2797167 RepID=UPI001904F7E6|nr:sensor histidine kinase [Streptomyces sp. HSG2]
MVSVASPARSRELPYTRVLLPPAILMGAATGAAVAVVAEPARIAVGVLGALATLLVTVTVADAARRVRALRIGQAARTRHVADLERRISRNDADLSRLGREILPAAVAYLRQGNAPRDVLARLGDLDPSYGALGEPQRALLRSVLELVDLEDTAWEASQRSFVDIARRVQAIVHQQANELREMEEDHGRNPEVFHDLLRIDHGNALIGRLADSIAVIGGGRPGRQWPAPVALYSVLRGAMSRILEYRRIDLSSIAKISVRGTAVEPVIHAAAELLDNATRYSPPNTDVHVTATEVQTGVAIEIEDAGVNLSEDARTRIEGMLESARQGTDLADIAGNPRLGLAVVGRLCAAFDMRVSLRASAYGGVRAILVVPRDMLTDDPGVGLAHGIGAASLPAQGPDALPGPRRRPKKRRPTSPPSGAPTRVSDDVPEVTEWTAGGLPQRRSRVRTPLSRRIAEQAADEREHARREALTDSGPPRVVGATTDGRAGEGAQEDPPGLWVEAFWEGLKGEPDPTAFTQPPNETRDRADDEGDPQ